MLHACYLLFILCLCMSVKSSTELMLYVVLTMPTLNKAYLFIYIYLLFKTPSVSDLINGDIHDMLVSWMRDNNITSTEDVAIRGLFYAS